MLATSLTRPGSTLIYALALLLMVATLATTAGCVAKFRAPSPDEPHGHLVVYNRHGGGMLRAFVMDGKRQRLMAEISGEGYRYVRIPTGSSMVRFETDVSGVRYPSDPIRIDGLPDRITLIGVDKATSSIRVLGGPMASTLIDRVRTGDKLSWSEVD
jgi:hypothetical protein